MADHGDMLVGTRLFQELLKSDGRGRLSKSEVAQLSGMVSDVAKTIGPLLDRIKLTFRQYTNHDLNHSMTLIEHMGNLIPPDTLKRLNGLELALLILSAMLHDSGMVVADGEMTATLSSEEFRQFRDQSQPDRMKASVAAREAGKEAQARAIEDAIVAEFYRRLHPERARQMIGKFFRERFIFREVDFSRQLGDLCESHAWGVGESNEPRTPDKAVAKLDPEELISTVSVNLQYLACCLRLADILDFDRSRTPLAVYQHIDFTEEKSWEEWNKHLQVKGLLVEPTRLRFRIECTHPTFYVAVQEFVGWIDSELIECRALLDRQPGRLQELYLWELPQVVDRTRIRMEDPTYLAGAFRFNLEYEEILNLLMDKSLYPEPRLFLRELLQNSLDACRRKKAEVEASPKQKGRYEGRIAVWDLSDDKHNPRVVFQDNGIGMSLRIVQEYFLRVGRSYYKSPEFELEGYRLAGRGVALEASSLFGIGILSCFLLSDRFEVLTLEENGETLHITVEGPSKYFVIRRLGLDRAPWREYSELALDFQPWVSGTRVVVHLREASAVRAREVLKNYAVNIDFDLAVRQGASGDEVCIGKYGWEQPVGPQDCGDLLSCVGFSDAEKCAAELSSVLYPSEIPFGRWQFSRHLRGRAWLYLLRRAEGLPCPGVGYLVIEDGLQLRGHLFDAIQALRSLELHDQEFVTWLVSMLRGWRLSSPGMEVAVEQLCFALSKQCEDFPSSQRGRYCRCLLDALVMLVPKELAEFTETLLNERRQGWRSESKVESHIEPWFGVNGVADQLRSRNREWIWSAFLSGLDIEKIFNDSVKWTWQSEHVAWYGIRIPGGFVYWDPERGEGWNANLPDVFGSAQIDLRVKGMETPGASRLFLPYSARDRAMLPVVRAFLRHSLELSEGRPREEGWEAWLSGVLRSVGEWGEAVFEFDEEVAEVRRRGICEVMVKGERLFVPVKSVGQYFEGPVANVRRVRWGFGRGEHGFVGDSGLNWFLLRRNLSKQKEVALEELLASVR